MPSLPTPLMGFLSLGWPEFFILVALISILFFGPRLHQLARGVTRMPLEFLKGRREHPKPQKDSGEPKT